MFCDFPSYGEIIRRRVWFISLWKEAYLPPWADCPSTSKRSAGSLKQTRCRRWEEWCRVRLLCTSWFLPCLWTTALQERWGSSATRFRDNGVGFAVDLAPELSWPKLSKRTLCHVQWCPPWIWQLEVSFLSPFIFFIFCTHLDYSPLTLALMQQHEEQGEKCIRSDIMSFSPYFCSVSETRTRWYSNSVGGFSSLSGAFTITTVQSECQLMQSLSAGLSFSCNFFFFTVLLTSLKAYHNPCTDRCTLFGWRESQWI